MKKIFIIAYTCLNLGDDLFVKILCERYPKHQFTIICSNKNAKPFKEIPNLEIVRFSNFYRITDGLFLRLNIKKRIFNILTQRYIKKSDLTVHIGGSIFIENNGWKNRASHYIEHIKASNQFHILGSNFGPYTDNEYYETYSKIFQEVNDICFRESYSYDLFPTLDNTRLASDIVFSMTSEKALKNYKQIIISVINLKSRERLSIYVEEYESKIKDICEQLVNDGFTIKLMGFCKKEGDKEAINRILARISKKNKKSVEAYNYNGDLKEALLLINQSSGIIATRFHSMILGWVYGLNTIPITYSDKMINVIKDTNFKGLYTEVNKVNDLIPVDVSNYFKTKKLHDISTQVKLSNRQFLNMDNLLK